MHEADLREQGRDGDRPPEAGVRVARALLLACGIATLWMADSGRLNWGVWDQPAPLVVGAFPLLLWICTWQVFRCAQGRVTPVPIRDRARSALAGGGAVLLAAAICWLLIPSFAPTPNYYPERYVESQAKLVPETLGVIFLGVVGTLLLPSGFYEREARDPVRAVLSWPALPLIPLVIYWAPLKYSVTHVGPPAGWGRLVFLLLAFGVGWASAARTAHTSRITAGRDQPARAMWLDVPYLTLLVLALLVGMFSVGHWLHGYQGGLYMYPFMVILVALLSSHWRAPRADSNATELGRTLLLSVPLLVVLAATAAILIAAGAGTTLSQPGLLLVPGPVAATGTLWLLGSLAIAMVRLGHARAAHAPAE